ncbi:MAG: hypothetical protein IJK31_02205 [Ruminococcus sp.]|nr:hypothetical protein [Ruminococcus sp.]
MQQYLCFADFEFTCGSPAHRLRSEMLSVGVVVCDCDYNIMETFYCTARPNHFPKLTSQCKRLTKLTQAEINQSPDSETVLENVAGLLTKYTASELYVWGNFDKPGLLSDRKQHIQFKKPHNNIDIVCSAIKDIQDEMVKEMQLPQAISIEELASAFGYTPETGTFHNALNDAEALYTIHKAVHTSDFLNCPQFVSLKQERLEHLAAVRAAQEEKRKELALSYELSPEEKKYYEAITASGSERAVKRFIQLRSKLVNSFTRYPDENDFVMIIYSQPRRIRIMPRSKYSKVKSQGALRTEFFSKDNAGRSVVQVCSESVDK